MKYLLEIFPSQKFERSLRKSVLIFAFELKWLYLSGLHDEQYM